ESLRRLESAEVVAVLDDRAAVEGFEPAGLIACLAVESVAARARLAAARAAALAAESAAECVRPGRLERFWSFAPESAAARAACAGAPPTTSESGSAEPLASRVAAASAAAFRPRTNAMFARCWAYVGAKM